MSFGKSETNFDILAAESCQNGRRNAEPPKLPALFPNCMHCRLNWPGNVYVRIRTRAAHIPFLIHKEHPAISQYLAEMLQKIITHTYTSNLIIVITGQEMIHTTSGTLPEVV